MQPEQTQQRRATLWLAALLVASFTLSLWYGLATPLGEGPDEPAHLEYALYLAREGRLPAPGAALDHPGEAHQPPLAYVLAQPLIAWLPEHERRIELSENPRWTWRGGTEPAAYFRRTAEQVAPHGLTLAWRLVRGLSAALGTVTVGLIYVLARRLGCGIGTALGAAALVASLPQFAFQHGLVSNDPLLWMLTAATLVWLIPGCKVSSSGSRKLLAESERDEALTSTREIFWAIGVGALVGAALLTKANAIVLLPVAASGMWLRWRAGLLRRPWRAAALAALAMLTISGWWFWGNLRRTGDPWGIDEFRSVFATAPFEPGQLEQWATAGRVLGTSLIARFGWVNLSAPAPIYWLAAGIALLGLVGLIKGVRRGARPSSWALLPALTVGLTLAWIVAFALTAGQVAAQGRFLFPALPALAVALAWGIAQLRPHRVWLCSSVAALGLAAAFLPATTIQPAYRWLTIPPQEDTPMLGRFAGSGEPGVELRNASFPQAVQAGGTLPVTLTWHTLGRPGRNWTVFVHLARSGERHPVVALDEQPLGGEFPTLAWTSGDWVRDHHVIAIPLEVTPGWYELRVGLFDPQANGLRAAVYDGKRLAGNQIKLGMVQVDGTP